MSDGNDFPFRSPKPNRAKKLSNEAYCLALEGKYREALPLVERAIRLDQIGALNSYRALRNEICSSWEDDKPKVSTAFYNHGVECKQQGRSRDAKVAYMESYSHDATFLWPINNYAWICATSKDDSLRDGSEALRYALLTCELSNWNCWAFLGTLAAAFAECGNYPAAVGWKKSAMCLLPVDHLLDAILQLRHYEAGRSYIDEGLPVAAGRGRLEGTPQ